MNLAEIRELAGRYSPAQLQQCIEQVVADGANPCSLDGNPAELIDTLAKAETVRMLIESGMTETEAIRELARRIRELQGARGA